MYWTIKIGWQKWNATKWHPTEETGPFAVLVRGTFSTSTKAKTWAERELGVGGNWTIEYCEW